MKAQSETVYMATMLAGVEPIVVDEIRSKIGDAQIVEIRRGKVFFSSKHSVSQVKSLRTVDNLYIYIGRFPVGPHKIHLKDLEENMRRMDISKAIDLDKYRHRNVTFAVNASLSGKQTYSRFDLSEAANRGLQKQFPTWTVGTPDHRELEFRLDVTDDQAVFCYRLTDSAFRFRGGQRMFSPAALRPTVAHALVWHSRPDHDEFFLDPFCGSGTIIAERAYYPFGKLYGGDISEDAVEVAKQNVANIDGAVISRWDARHLPLDQGTVDKVVSNLPFGEQILDPSEIYDLYLKFVKELKRVMKPNGSAFLMTDKVKELLRVTDKFGLECYVELELSLKGLHPKVFKVNF